MSDPLDVLSLPEAELAIGFDLGNAPENGRKLEWYVTSISRRIDDLCGAVVRRTVTEEHRVTSGLIFLRHPVVSVTSVAEWTSGATPTSETLTTADYSADIAGGILRRVGTSWINSSYYDTWTTVSYVAGRYEDTASVDAVFKSAAAECLAYQWRQSAPPHTRPNAFDEFGPVPWLSIDEMLVRRLAGERRLSIG